jgi:hypothetical protein
MASSLGPASAHPAGEVFERLPPGLRSCPG